MYRGYSSCGVRVIAICLAGFAAMTGCRSKERQRTALVRRELPGASVRLPAGTESETHIDYAAGRIRIDTPGSDAVILEWQTGEVFTAKLFEDVLVKSIMNTVPGELEIVERGDITVAGASGIRFVLRPKHVRDRILRFVLGENHGEDRLLILSMWGCGKRWFSLVTGKIEGRIRETFVCQPDPARDGKTRTIGVQLSPGPDFGMVPSEGQLLTQSLDGEAMVVVPVNRHVISDEKALAAFLPTFLGAVFESSGISEVTFGALSAQKVGTQKRKLLRGRGKTYGYPMRLLVTVLECGDGVYLTVYGGAENTPETRGIKLIFDARCSTNPTQIRLFSEVAQEACARGDQRGCDLREASP